MAVSSATRAAVWFTEQRGTGNYAVYAKGDGAERKWIVLLGPFQDRARAEAAAQDVERRAGVSNPWIRSVAEVQAEIDPSELTQAPPGPAFRWRQTAGMRARLCGRALDSLPMVSGEVRARCPVQPGEAEQDDDRQ